MIAAARGDVQGAEDFFILDVAARRRQFLRAETQLADFARDGIGLQLAVVFIDDALAALAATAAFCTRPPATSIRPRVPSS